MRSNKDLKVKAFLSYSTTDKELAGWIKFYLERLGFDAFLAHEDIQPSLEWQEEILSQLKVCDVFIVILTDNYHDSAWTDHEAGFALARDIIKKDIIIIPLNAGINPYGFIGRYQALPLDPKNFKDIEMPCLEITRTVRSRNQIFEDMLLKGAIETFGNSGTFDEAGRNARYLLQFKALLNTDLLNQILTLAIANAQINNSFKAIRILSSLVEELENKIDPSLVAEYKGITG